MTSSRLDLENAVLAQDRELAGLERALQYARDDAETLGIEKADLERELDEARGVIRRLVETRKAALVQPDDELVAADMAAAWAGAERWLA